MWKSSRSESLRIGNTGHQRGCERRSDARDLIQALARLVGSMPSQDALIELQDLRLQHPQLRTKGFNKVACDLRHAIIIGVRDNVEQFLDSVATNRRYDAELGKMRAELN